MACGEQQRRSHMAPLGSKSSSRKLLGSRYFQGKPVSRNYCEAKIEKDVNVVNTQMTGLMIVYFSQFDFE